MTSISSSSAKAGTKRKADFDPCLTQDLRRVSPCTTATAAAPVVATASAAVVETVGPVLMRPVSPSKDAKEQRQRRPASPSESTKAYLRKGMNSVWKYSEADDLAVTGSHSVSDENSKCDHSVGYGEPTRKAVEALLSEAKKRSPNPCDRFIDLGSGSGKIVLSAALTFLDAKEIAGVEIVTARVNVARKKLTALKVALPDMDEQLNRVAFYEADLCGFNLDHYTHVYVFGTAFTQTMINTIVAALSRPSAKWKVIIFVPRSKTSAPTIAGKLPDYGKQVRMAKSNQSMTFHIYARH